MWHAETGNNHRLKEEKKSVVKELLNAASDEGFIEEILRNKLNVSKVDQLLFLNKHKTGSTVQYRRGRIAEQKKQCEEVIRFFVNKSYVQSIQKFEYAKNFRKSRQTY